MDFVASASRYLLASPGAIVAKAGRLFRIPTLVPARRSDDACIFLTADNRCSIHPVSPYGCAFFDSHMSKQQAERRSVAGLNQIANAWKNDENYAEIWGVLCAKGRFAPGPEEGRNRLRRMMSPVG
jgi:hypothetical protein